MQQEPQYQNSRWFKGLEVMDGIMGPKDIGYWRQRIFSLPKIRRQQRKIWLKTAKKQSNFKKFFACGAYRHRRSNISLKFGDSGQKISHTLAHAPHYSLLRIIFLFDSKMWVWWLAPYLMRWDGPERSGPSYIP